MLNKKHNELAVFKAFAGLRPLPFILDSSENRNPPEPDILCSLENGSKVACELVSAEDETANKANPGTCIPVDKVFGDNISLKRAIEDAYFAAVEAGEVVNRERFHYQSIHVHFEDSVSFKKSRKAVPDVVRLINECSTGTKVIRNGIVRCIEIAPYPIPCDYTGPMFYANSSARSVGLTVVDRIKSKLKKRYETLHPIHLLVHSQSTIAAEVEFWRAELLELIAAEGMGAFDHIWVYGRHHNTIVFDLGHPPV